MFTIKRVLFLGSKHLGLRVLQEMHAICPESLLGVLTFDDRNDTRTVFNGIQEFANENGLPFFVAKNKGDANQIISQVQPELCIVVGWYWLISPITSNAVPFGFIGIHNSLLPKYRGGSPLIWPIINNEKEVGISFFTFTPGMDDGPIWAQGRVSVDDQDYISDILTKLENRTIEVLHNHYTHILNCSIEPIEQDHTAATYCAQRFPNDGNINWNSSAHDIHNFVRAQSDPYPGSFTYADGQKLRIWRATLFDRPYYGTPGQVAQIAKEGVYVICGDNRAIVLKEVSLADQRGEAIQFIQSIKTRLSSFVRESISTDE